MINCTFSCTSKAIINSWRLQQNTQVANVLTSNSSLFLSIYRKKPEARDSTIHFNIVHSFVLILLSYINGVLNTFFPIIMGINYNAELKFTSELLGLGRCVKI